MKKIITLFLLVLVLTGAGTQSPPGQDARFAQIKLPPGFSIEVYADMIPRARQLAKAPDGTVFVGTTGDSVWALTDQNRDGRVDEKIRLLSGLNAPNGVAYHQGALHVAEINRVHRITFPNGLRGRLEDRIIYADLPGLTHHGYKYIKVGPDGLLYLPLGMPCNVCLQEDPRFGTIMRLGLDGAGLEIYASGIRNSVGFDFHPLTRQLWFTDNGRDYLGDDLPPDELNHAPQKGLHFGFPYFHGKSIPDPSFGNQTPPNFTYRPPARELGAHVASLGMTFYTGTMFPAAYRNQIFIAEHGSWNRSTPIGYRITLIELIGNTANRSAVFADNFLAMPGGRGRPVDVLVADDGSLLVSDDARGAVYRITFQGR